MVQAIRLCEKASDCIELMITQIHAVHLSTLDSHACHVGPTHPLHSSTIQLCLKPIPYKHMLSCLHSSFCSERRCAMSLHTQ